MIYYHIVSCNRSVFEKLSVNYSKREQKNEK